MAEASAPTVEAAMEQPAAIVDETSPPENDAEVGADVVVAVSAGDSDADGGRGGNRNNNSRGSKRRSEKKDPVPIEELYDLSKPIKRMERPSKENHDAEVDAIDAAIDALRAERRTLQSRIDAALGGGGKGTRNDPRLSRERDALNRLKNRKGLMIEQKRQIRTRLEVARADADRLAGRARTGGTGGRNKRPPSSGDPDDIDAEIGRLQRRQETSSMTLAEEKGLLREIETLRTSRKAAEEGRRRRGELDGVWEGRRVMGEELKAKDREIDAIRGEIEAQAGAVKGLTEEAGARRGAVDDLLRKREGLRRRVDEEFAGRTELKAKFREETNGWYQNQRAVKAQRQLQYEEEKKQREEERLAWLKKEEEVELAKIPYEEEMELCNYLADYLTKTYLTDGKEEAEKKKRAAEEKTTADVVAVKDNPFAGFKAVSKREDEDEIYYGKKGKKATAGKKGGKSKSKKAGKPVAFSLNLDLFDQFGMLSLNPPTSLDAVSVSVDELTAKKRWYSEQPRGSVPTARDIRKAAKASGSGGGSNGKHGKGGAGNRNSGKSKANRLDITSDEFAPLGAGASVAAGGDGAASTSWGQKPSEHGHAS